MRQYSDWANSKTYQIQAQFAINYRDVPKLSDFLRKKKDRTSTVVVRFYSKGSNFAVFFHNDIDCHSK